MITVFSQGFSDPQSSIFFTGQSNPNFGITQNNWSALKVSNLQNIDNYGGLSVENSNYTAWSFWIKPGWPGGSVNTYQIGFLQYNSPSNNNTINNAGLMNNVWIAYSQSTDQLIFEFNEYYTTGGSIVYLQQVKYRANLTTAPNSSITGISNISSGNSWNMTTAPDWAHLAFVYNDALDTGNIYWNGQALSVIKEENQGPAYPSYGVSSGSSGITLSNWTWNTTNGDPYKFIGAIEKDSLHLQGDDSGEGSSTTSGENGTYWMDKLVWDRGDIGSVWSSSEVSSLYGAGAPGTDFTAPFVNDRHIVEWDFQAGQSFQSDTNNIPPQNPASTLTTLQIINQFTTGPSGTPPQQDTNIFVQ